MALLFGKKKFEQINELVQKNFFLHLKNKYKYRYVLARLLQIPSIRILYYNKCKK